MNLVEGALSRPEEQREAYLRNACATDSELLSQAWRYVQAEERMGSFLREPFVSPIESGPPFTPGQLIMHRFRIIREVARGGMGIVWEAFDEKMDLRVALKCARLGFDKRLSPEVRNARDISHPNVCNIFEIHTTKGPLGEIDFISMEFLEGETLSERLRRTLLSKQQSLAIALQLCAGLAEAHRNDVTHGDLKTNNVILAPGPDGSERAVIMDFGLASRQGSLGHISAMEALAGTPCYMAPELWRGVKPSVASDIYALGVVLWELVSGRRPSNLATASTLPLSEPNAWKLPPWHGRWSRVIARCLELNPAQRFQSAEEVAQALGPPRSRRWLLGAAAAAAVAVVSGVLTYQHVTAPSETVRLALLPFTSVSGNSALSENLLRGAAVELAQLKSSSRTRFIFIPLDKVLGAHVDTPEKARAALSATHVLGGTVEQQSKAILVHVYVKDVHSGANIKEWNAEYNPPEIRYAPGALSGVVTAALHLPLAQVPQVNAAAQADYRAGLAALRRDSETDAALKFFQRAITADHDSPLPYAGLAEAQSIKFNRLADKRLLGPLRESLRQTENRNPDLPQVHRVAGLLSVKQGWNDQAIAEYRRAIEIDPADAVAWERLGPAYRQNNQFSEALASIHKAIDLEPRQYSHYDALGSFYFRTGDYAEAAKNYRVGVSLAPREWPLYYGLGGATLNSGDLAEAEKQFRTSISLYESAVALDALAELLIYQQEDKLAIPLLERSLALNPERYRSWLKLGDAYDRTGRASEGQQAYGRGLEAAEAQMLENPNSGSVRAGMACLSAHLGFGRRAEVDLSQALQQSPHDADVLFMAALTYETLRQRDNTISVLAAAPHGVLADLSRSPDVAELHKDSRFLMLLTAYHPQK